ncbi:AAA family ATPase [Luminiphilus sp. nBUS_16]|uniref:AAA family ATPase n=1 Tax=Luminiphilus sp. nBUS_16 TaxID=3395315 RepID=UPI003EBA59E6
MTDRTRADIADLTARVNAAVIGQEAVVHSLILALLCNGNVLLEGLPGTAKTRSIKTLARAMGVNLGRIQFTPDLLPADVTGSETYHSNEGGSELIFEPGPIFNELVLADEINRAPAKVQSALLEAMEERQVTVAGKSYPLPPLFLVMATQNPIEQEGTYPLPEAQMDRFLFKVRVDYPDAEAERSIVRMLQKEEGSHHAEQTPVGTEAIFAARQAIQKMTFSEPVERYLVDLVMATRQPESLSEELASWIAVGSSPRASISLHRASRAEAWLQGREHVLPEDVRAVAPAVLRHRLILSYDALADGIDTDKVVTDILDLVAAG